MRRPILIGESSPRLGDAPLNAHRPGSTGHRMWRMMNAHTDVTIDSYHAAFDRRNLCRYAWDAAEARKLAGFLRHFFRDGQRVVLLGQRVRQSFDVPDGVSPHVERGVVYYVIPHPSGHCLWYNSANNRSHVGKLLVELYSGYCQDNQ
jgi:hypothetical protein